MFPLCFLHISGAYPSQFHGGLEGHSIPKLPHPTHPSATSQSHQDPNRKRSPAPLPDERYINAPAGPSFFFLEVVSRNTSSRFFGIVAKHKGLGKGTKIVSHMPLPGAVNWNIYIYEKYIHIYIYCTVDVKELCKIRVPSLCWERESLV